MRLARFFLLIGVLASWLLSACSSAGPPSGNTDPSGPDETEPVQVRVALTNIPVNTFCVRFRSTPVAAMPDARTYDQLASVMPGTPATIAIRGLPFGVSLSMIAEAFDQACSSVTDKSLASWMSDGAALVSLTYGEIVNLSFRLRPTGGANGTLDFLYFTLAPLSQSFGSRVIGDTTGPLATFTAKNVGTTPTGVVSASITGASASSFVIASNTCTAALAPQATCAVQIRLVPAARGPLFADLAISGTPGGTLTATLGGVGLLQATLSIAPTSQNFGTLGLTQVGPPVTFVVTNVGDVPSGVPAATITSTTPSEPQSQFRFLSGGNTCTSALAASQTCNVQVVFGPLPGIPLGMKSATLAVSASPGGAVTSALTGNAVAAPAITINPPSFTFPAPSPPTPPTTTFTVLNTGGVPAGPLTATLGGANPTDFQISSNNCGVVPVMANCTISVRAVPASGGLKNATLQVTSTSMSGVGAMATMSVNAPAPLSPNVTFINFGSTTVTGGTIERVLNIRNVGVITTGPISLTTSRPEFQIPGSTNGCNVPLAPNANCNVTVVFNPSSQNSFTGTLNGTATPGGTLVVNLSGTGVFP